MAFIPTPNNVRVAMQGSVAGNDQVVTLWFAGASPATAFDLDSLATALAFWWNTELTPLLSNGFQLDSIYLIAQDNTTAPSLVYTTGMPFVGLVNSPVQSPQTAPVIKFSTAARGRSGRGRNYVPGCPLSGLASPGVVSSTFRNNLVGAYAALPTYLLSIPYGHCVVQHVENGVPLAAGFPRLVNGYSMVSDSLGTQRSRRIGIGS